MPVPEDNPITVEKVALGRRLFHDRRLSRDRSISCASCHDPDRAFTDGRPIAIGEIGWPSRGRWREDAAPSRVNQAVFIREFITLSREMGFDYNLIEAFDQVWKYKSEGTVGAA